MLLFDPWLLPWFAESSVPSLWGPLLPKPAAVFLTHDHDDHVDPRTLLHLPKDTPIIVPSRRNRRTLSYDYLSLLRELGFGRVIELAHGESWAFEGGAVYSVPFYGEDPCDLEMPRNCYLIADRGYNVLVHADSGPTNSGKSALKDGVIQSLAQKHGPIPLVFASQQQLLEVRGHAAHAPLSHPGKWLDVGENGYLTNEYLADVCAAAQAKLFVSYATGGADWYPDHLSFMFSQRNPARTALLTAHWERPETLKELLVKHGCGYHYGHALDLFRRTTDGLVEPLTTGEALTPLSLYRLDHGDPPFMNASSHTTPSREIAQGPTMTTRKTQHSPILVTGVAGFIGFHTATRLLERGERVIGLDNVNDYYDVRLKKARLAKLKPFKSVLIHEARSGQSGRNEEAVCEATNPARGPSGGASGVRYSLVNPHAYTDSNIEGFLNILEGCRQAKVEHLVYASSSSVYGGNTQMPFSIHDNVDHPVSLYAASKKANELMAHCYAHLYRIPCTGLRFFTVYGPWGGLTWRCSSSLRRFWKENRSRSTTTERCSAILPISMTSLKE